MAKGNWLDGVVGYFSPRSGFERMRARSAIDQVRKYEAATAGRRTGGWTTSNAGSVNAEIGPALTRVRERCRDLVRNQPYANKAISVIESNVIGTGIVCRIQGGESLVKRIQALWKSWAETTDCDVAGLHSFSGLQSLAMRTIAESGEVLILKRWRRGGDKDRIPFQIQVLEGDFIDTTKSMEAENGGYILQGVEFDKNGKRVAYWLWNQHPGETILLSLKQGLISRRVDAKEVLHVFRVERSGQVRGIAWGAPIVIRLRDFDEYEDAQLVRQKIAACFSGFVQDLETPIDAVAAKKAFPDRLEPGAIEILGPGKTITFPNIPTVSDDGHSARILRSVAVGFGITYESLTGDLGNVNFSSGRMGWIEMGRNIEKWQWHMIIPRLCEPTFAWFLDGCELLGIPIKDISASWTVPRRAMIDPSTEIAAMVNAIRGGLATLPEAIRELGYDPKEHIQEIADSNAQLDALGIILDSDPRRVMKAGILQTPTAAELTPPKPAEKKAAAQAE